MLLARILNFDHLKIFSEKDFDYDLFTDIHYNNCRSPLLFAEFIPIQKSYPSSLEKTSTILT